MMVLALSSYVVSQLSGLQVRVCAPGGAPYHPAPAGAGTGSGGAPGARGDGEHKYYDHSPCSTLTMSSPAPGH